MTSAELWKLLMMAGHGPLPQPGTPYPDSLLGPLGLIFAEVEISLYAAALPTITTRRSDLLELVAESDLRQEVAYLDVYYHSLQPCLASYDEMTDSDQVLYARVIALTALARLNSFLPKTEATAPIKQVTLGIDTFVYGNQAVSKKTLEEQWLDEAYEAYKLLSCVAEEIGQQVTRVFALAGRRRTARAALYGSAAITGVNPLYELLGDARQRYEWRGVL